MEVTLHFNDGEDATAAEAVNLLLLLPTTKSDLDRHSGEREKCHTYTLSFLADGQCDAPLRQCANALLLSVRTQYTHYRGKRARFQREGRKEDSSFPLRPYLPTLCVRVYAAGEASDQNDPL